jgi:hypothetical protein
MKKIEEKIEELIIDNWKIAMLEVLDLLEHLKDLQQLLQQLQQCLINNNGEGIVNTAHLLHEYLYMYCRDIQTHFNVLISLCNSDPEYILKKYSWVFVGEQK